MEQETGQGAVADAGHKLNRKSVIGIFIALMVGMFVGSLDQTVTSTALPTIVGELGGVDKMVWITTGYMLASTLVMPIYGKVSDMAGRKYPYCICFVLFLAGSVMCAMAPNIPVIVAGRVIQGLGGGGQIILSQAIVADLFPPRERGKYMGLMGAVFAVSTVAGPTIGGFFTEYISWRWCFWINVPLSVIALCLVITLLPHRKKNPGALKGFDWAGTCAACIAASALILGVTLGGNMLGWDSPVIYGLFALCIVAAVILIVIERKTQNPILPLRFFKNRNFVLCTVGGLITMLAVMGVITYLPTYLQIVCGLSAAFAGYAILPMMLGTMVTSTAMGFIASKTGNVNWMPPLSCLLVGIGLAMLSTLTLDSSIWFILASITVLGIGAGIGQQILVLIVQNEFRINVVGAATASNNFFREIGATLGTSVVGTLFTANLMARLTENLDAASSAGIAALGADMNSITPGLVAGLAEPLQNAVRLSYNEALTPVFLVLVPFLGLMTVAFFFLKKRVLSSTNETER